MTRDISPGAPPDYGALSEPQLVALAVELQVAENASRARRLRTFAEVRDRCAATHAARRASARQEHFVLTPTEETMVEMGPVLGLAEHAVAVALHQYDGLASTFPRFWELCEAGRLDLDSAGVLVEAARTIARPEDVAAFADQMADYLARHDDPSAPLVPLTRQQLSRAAHYRRRKFEQKDDEQRFGEAFAERRVRLNLDDNGMGHLGCTTACTDLKLADHRLTLVARKRCADPDEDRTLEQMRADTLVDLLLGRLTVGALTSELEDDELGDGGDPASTFTESALVGCWARPVINVTVPLTCLIGLDDEPGLMSGETVLPAELVRMVAHQPGSTWHRMLTDPAGRMVELSTESYQPTGGLVRTVVARDQTCVWPGCLRPSVECECDHRVAFPAGTTCACNLDPLCKRHHKAKHAEGFSVRRLADGGYEVVTPRGTRLVRRPFAQPTGVA